MKDYKITVEVRRTLRWHIAIKVVQAAAYLGIKAPANWLKKDIKKNMHRYIKIDY